MNKNKNGILTTITISFVILALLTIVTFALPFSKVNDVVYYVSYACAVVAIILEMILVLTQIFSSETPNQKIISLPIVYHGLICTIIQLVITILFYILNAFLSVPLWILVIVECLLYGVGIIRISLCYFFKESNKTYHETLANTSFMDYFRSRLKVLVKTNNNQNLTRELNDLLEIALGSDPSTNDKTRDIEQELGNALKGLEDTINSGLENNSIELIQNIKNTLIKRNELCKLGK